MGKWSQFPKTPSNSDPHYCSYCYVQRMGSAKPCRCPSEGAGSHQVEAFPGRRTFCCLPLILEQMGRKTCPILPISVASNGVEQRSACWQLQSVEMPSPCRCRELSHRRDRWRGGAQGAEG